MKNVVQFASLENKTDEKLLKVIASEEWDLLASGYGIFGIRSPSRPWRDPRSKDSWSRPGRKTFTESRDFDAPWEDLDQLIDKLTMLRTEVGNVPVRQTIDGSGCYSCGDEFYSRITYEVEYANPKYAEEQAKYETACKEWDEYPEAYKVWDKAYKVWLKERNETLPGEREERISFWTNQIERLIAKRLKASNHLSNSLRDHVVLNISKQMRGIDVRLRQIKLLLNEYEDPEWFPWPDKKVE